MQRPNMLVLAGHDPSGGAGLAADIESAAANGAHAATVCTVLTRQDTRDVEAVRPVEDEFFGACLDTIVADMTFAAVKTGAIASTGQVERIARLAAERTAGRPRVPWVVDPVLQAAGGGTLADDRVGRALRDRLFAHAELVTPNAAEARALCDGERDVDRCGTRLAALGPHVLITGGDENEPNVINRFYRPDGSHTCFEWPRLRGVFHGSGCTLASAIAAGLARGQPLETAVDHGQRFTARALEHAFAAGRGQKIPDRMARDAP